MQTLELLQEALELARELGYQIREESMGGVGGGACEFAGRKWLFLDLAWNAHEQLENVISVLKEDLALFAVADRLSPQLAWHLGWNDPDGGRPDCGQAAA